MSEKDMHLEPEEGQHTAKDDDVEGHVNLGQQVGQQLGKDEDAVEAHVHTKNLDKDEDAVEGHVHTKNLDKDDDDDVEGHVNIN